MIGRIGDLLLQAAAEIAELFGDSVTATAGTLTLTNAGIKAHARQVLQIGMAAAKIAALGGKTAKATASLAVGIVPAKALVRPINITMVVAAARAIAELTSKFAKAIANGVDGIVLAEIQVMVTHADAMAADAVVKIARAIVLVFQILLASLAAAILADAEEQIVLEAVIILHLHQVLGLADAQPHHGIINLAEFVEEATLIAPAIV